MKFKVLGKMIKKNSTILNNRSITLYFRRTAFEARDLLGRIPLQTTLEGKEAQQSCLISKGNFLYAEDLACRKQSKHSRRPARINTDLLTEFKR